MTTKTTDPEAVRAALQKEHSVMLDPLDVPGTWTERQKLGYEERRYRVAQHINNWPASRLEKPTARRAIVQHGLDRLGQIESTIDKMIEDAPDYRTIADARERDREWLRQQELTASKTALHRGVEYFNGQPALPAPLRTLLTDVCSHCGDAKLFWPGPIDVLENELVELDKAIAQAQASLRAHLASAEALLAEPVTS